MARINDKTDLLDVIAVMEPEGKPLKGMRICITGHLAKPRPEVQELIRVGGGEVHETMKWDTTHLVTNQDWTANSIKGKVSSKFEKARRQGTKIINEQTLLDMIIKGDAKARENQA